MAELVAIHWEDPHFMVNQELVLLIMQYLINIYSAISQISLLGVWVIVEGRESRVPSRESRLISREFMKTEESIIYRFACQTNR